MTDDKTTINELKELVKKFRDERDWKQFHNPKDMALSLVLEASEVLEHFQWKNAEEIEDYIRAHKEDIGDELADVFYWVLLMSDDMDLDLADRFRKKLDKSAKKYPIERAKGKSTKYNKL